MVHLGLPKSVSITLSNKEATTPAAASGTGGRANLIENLIESSQALPTPTLTPQPTPNSATPNPTVTPANITQVEPTPKQQTGDNQSITFENGTVAIMVAVFAMGLAIAGIIVSRSMSKLKGSTSYSR